MFERFGDLPLHVLVIHVTVLVLPVGALTAIVFALVPSSSPTNASRGRARESVLRITSSTFLSDSLTGVRSGLVATCRSSAL